LTRTGVACFDSAVSSTTITGRCVAVVTGFTASFEAVTTKCGEGNLEFVRGDRPVVTELVDPGEIRSRCQIASGCVGRDSRIDERAGAEDAVVVIRDDDGRAVRGTKLHECICGRAGAHGGRERFELHIGVGGDGEGNDIDIGDWRDGAVVDERNGERTVCRATHVVGFGFRNEFVETNVAARISVVRIAVVALLVAGDGAVATGKRADAGTCAGASPTLFRSAGAGAAVAAGRVHVIARFANFDRAVAASWCRRNAQAKGPGRSAARIDIRDIGSLQGPVAIRRLTDDCAECRFGAETTSVGVAGRNNRRNRARSSIVEDCRDEVVSTAAVAGRQVEDRCGRCGE